MLPQLDRKSVSLWAIRSCCSKEPLSNETFAYIVGYTGWGLPYGITWVEMERLLDQAKVDLSAN
ncbi:hypothetical protein D3C78_961010 [compost metagenome]